MSLLPQVVNEQITTTDLIREMAKDPFNKIVQGIRPDVKAAIEVPMGQSLFPDAFNPRSQNRSEGLVSPFGLRDELLYFRGLATGSGERARPHYIRRMFMGVSDPKRNALHEMYDLRAKFLKKQGRKQQLYLFLQVNGLLAR